MAEGTLIIEVYEYVENDYTVPSFEYIPCSLERCMKGNSATLKQIIQNGFDDLPKKDQNAQKRQEILQKLEDADIGRIQVAYHAGRGNEDPYINLTNVIPVSMSYADARQLNSHQDSIILYGRYRLTDGNASTILKDAQRLTLTYNTRAEENELRNRIVPEDPEEHSEPDKEICLNITYLQN